MRIVSLLPSATEIVADLGWTTCWSAAPPSATGRRRCARCRSVTAARVDTEQLRSAEIDAAVRAALLEGRSLYAIDEQVLAELEPDLIITQDLCRVCAVSSDEVSQLRTVAAEVVSLDPHTIGEVEASVRLLADRLDTCRRHLRARAGVVARMRRTIIAAMEAVAGRPVRRVFVAEWLDPPLRRRALGAGDGRPGGGEDVLGVAGRPSYATTWDAVARGAAGADRGRAVRIRPRSRPGRDGRDRVAGALGVRGRERLLLAPGTADRRRRRPAAEILHGVRAVKRPRPAPAG
jgi:iron complex transport system substrate-binding protein